eukprot:424314-Pelagomonas_calceolata.AAC.1
MFKNAGFTPASMESATRAGIVCACCEICNCPGGKEPLDSQPPYLDMYICDVCHRTYHWCMRELVCCTNEQRQDLDNNNNYWACPACAHLKEDEKLNQYSNSHSKELVRIA